LFCIEASAKASSNLGLMVAVEAENCKVRRVAVRRVLIDVMQLDLLAFFATFATGSVRCKQDVSSGVAGNRRANLWFQRNS
jgi:hypothetical protein